MTLTTTRINILILFLISLPILSIGQGINLVNGVPITIYSGISSDYIIPVSAGSVEVTVHGGDGGNVRFSNLICDITLKGGAGATVNATFEVGNGANQIPPGSRLRTFVGNYGGSLSLACGEGGGLFGGGGGSSAILYLPPGADEAGVTWRMLAVAGGGGGAARPSSGIDRVGGGGSSSEMSGGSGPSNGGISGVSNGLTGLTNGFLAGQAGKGYKSSVLTTQNGSMVLAYDEFASPILVKLRSNGEWSTTAVGAGGVGFTGGGRRGDCCSFVSGGGGGGYSGGSTQQNYGGGGGGSHLASGLSIISSQVSGGSSGGGSANSGFVIIKSIAAPVFAKCQNQTVALDVNGVSSFNVSQLNNGSSGAAPISSTVNGQSTLNFTCANIGNNPVILTITDAHNATSTCAATITVIDNIGPTASCQDITLQLNANGDGFINSCMIDMGSSDACSSFIGYSLSQTIFNCNDVGSRVVTLTATDMTGNNNTCSATVTVQDQIQPVASCRNHTVQLDGTGNGTITTAAVNNGSSDACGITSLSLNQTTFNCSDIGTKPVVLTVSDANGNTASCFSTISIQDNIAPIALCKSATVHLDANGMGMLSPQQVDNGSMDNCNIMLRNISQNNFSCINIGNNMITLTVMASNGSSSSCSASVNVIDNLAPTASCQNMTLQLDLQWARSYYS